MRKARLFRDRLREDLRNPEFRRAFVEADLEVRLAVEIAMARGKARLTQAQLARKLGTAQQTISRIERGEQNLTLETLSRIAAALGRQVVVQLRPLHARA